MIILLLLLFFKSICLYCQRVILHIYDQWINPKNARQLKEAIETKGSRLGYKYIYNQESQSQSRRRRKTSNLEFNRTALITTGNTEYCNFCVHTPQGYCRHHFHLQELYIHKLQQQQQQQQQKQQQHEHSSLWFPLQNHVDDSMDLKQLRKIKKHLKSYLQEQQQQQQQQQQQKQQEQSTRTQKITKKRG